VCARDTSLLTRVRHRLQPPVDRTRRAENDDDLQIEKAIPRGYQNAAAFCEPAVANAGV